MTDSDSGTAWNEQPDATFLVCVHNVSSDQPYAILRAPLSSTAQDIVVQVFLIVSLPSALCQLFLKVLVKARRMDDPAKFELIEELPPQANETQVQRSPLLHREKKRAKSVVKRSVRMDENVYAVQTAWKTTGRLLLHEKECGVEKVCFECSERSQNVCFPGKGRGGEIESVWRGEEYARDEGEGEGVMLKDVICLYVVFLSVCIEGKVAHWCASAVNRTVLFGGFDTKKARVVLR